MRKTLVILSHDTIESSEFSPLSLHSNAEKYTSARESHKVRVQTNPKGRSESRVKETAGSPWASLLLLLGSQSEILPTP